MPTYEYECGSCGYRFDLFQSMTARPRATCPRCKKRARRLISAGGGLLFKGGGFYMTDYRSSSYKRKAQAEANSSDGAKDSGGCGKPGCASSAGASSGKSACAGAS